MQVKLHFDSYFGKDVDVFRALDRKHYDRDYVHEIAEAISRVKFSP